MYGLGLFLSSASCTPAHPGVKGHRPRRIHAFVFGGKSDNNQETSGDSTLCISLPLDSLPKRLQKHDRGMRAKLPNFKYCHCALSKCGENTGYWGWGCDYYGEGFGLGLGFRVPGGVWGSGLNVKHLFSRLKVPALRTNIRETNHGLPGMP